MKGSVCGMLSTSYAQLFWVSVAVNNILCYCLHRIRCATYENEILVPLMKQMCRWQRAIMNCHSVGLTRLTDCRSNGVLENTSPPVFVRVYSQWLQWHCGDCQFQPTCVRLQRSWDLWQRSGLRLKIWHEIWHFWTSQNTSSGRMT